MRVLVCGGRDYNNVERVYAVLDDIGPSVIISGCAPGADSIALMWADERGVTPDPYPADWQNLGHPDAIIKTRRNGTRYDARAGHRRNQKMLDAGLPDLVVAFPGGSGTADMVRRAKVSKIPITLITN